MSTQPTQTGRVLTEVLPLPPSSTSANHAGPPAEAPPPGESTPLLHAVVQKDPLRPISPENNANYFSRVMLWWMNGFFALGRQRQLQEEDLYEMRPRYNPKMLGDLLRNNWADEMATAKSKNRKPSLVRACIKTFGKEVAFAYIFMELGDLCMIANPLVLQQLLIYFQDSLDPATAPPVWQGYAMAVALVFLTLAGSIFYQQWNCSALRTGIRFRTVLVDTIFQKATRLSNKAHLVHTDGSIVNLMSTDANRVDLAMTSITLVVTVPIYTLIVIGLMVHLLGPSALAGAALLLLANPAQAWAMSWLAPLRKSASVYTDSRIRLVTEILQGIKVIKLFGWEANFLSKLSEIRVKELRLLKRLLTIRALVAASSSSLPVFASALSIVIYASLGNQLSAEIIFPAIAYFQILRVPLLVLPTVMAKSSDAIIALGRIQVYLEAEETEPSAPIEPKHPYAISIKNGNFYWDVLPSTNTNEKQHTTTMNDPALYEEIDNSSDRNSELHVEDLDGLDDGVDSLMDINITIPRGALVAVVGPVGSGKSSLLQAMVGIMPQSKGTVVRGATMSYAPQTPWIQNANARNNVLFDSPFDETRFNRVIKACNLIRDFDSLPAGDLTEIGERGVNLSGGQKARLSLARSVYFNADIVIADDPLSAVDAHVGKSLWNDCFRGELQDRTRIIATHQLHILPEADYIICMKDGRISEEGTFKDLMAKQGVFSEMMAQYGGLEGESDESEDSEDSVELEEEIAIANDNLPGLDSKRRRSRADTIKSMRSTIGDAKSMKSVAVNGPEEGKLMTEEERESGAIDSKVYMGYMQTTSVWVWVTICLLFFLQQVANVMGNLWLAWWTNDSFHLSFTAYILTYVAWAVAQLILVFMAATLLVSAVNETARIAHEKAIERVIKSPMSWYDTTPLGRILNRFSRDVDTLDSEISSVIYEFLLTLSTLLGTFILIIVVFPWLMLAMVPLLFLYQYIAQYYRSTSREVKRLDSTLRSVLYAHFSESLIGLGTLRAFNAVDRAIATNQSRINLSNRAYYMFQIGARWLTIRVNLVGVLLSFATTLVIVATRNKISPATVGLVLSYLGRINGDLNWGVQRFTQLENNMNSAERIVHYMNNLEVERPADIPEMKPKPEWPAKGDIEFKEVSMRYRPELPCVLKEVSLAIQSGHKVGVVGRTGAGKSSLIQAIFRLVELDAGQILIDGIDIATIGTLDLRSRIAIIPQDPVLFGGTMRYNLDPLGRYTEQELWQVLETSDLKSFVQQQEGGLDAVIADQGENLSVGQRQLVCLSRALLAKAKVVILDEATASVDLATDALIQRAIRKDFASSTVFCIAHRLNTIIDYDKVLVMDMGRVAEYASPSELLDNEQTIFSSLVNETGPQNAALLKSLTRL